jgi:hypothetical protein
VLEVSVVFLPDFMVAQFCEKRVLGLPRKNEKTQRQKDGWQKNETSTSPSIPLPTAEREGVNKIFGGKVALRRAWVLSGPSPRVAF